MKSCARAAVISLRINGKLQVHMYIRIILVTRNHASFRTLRYRSALFSAYFLKYRERQSAIAVRLERNSRKALRTHLAEIRETTDLRHLTGFIRRAAVCPNEPTGQ